MAATAFGTIGILTTLDLPGIPQPEVPKPGTGTIYYDQGTNTWMIASNGGAYAPLGGGGASSLQDAYDGGNTIATAGGLPVDITKGTVDATAGLSVVVSAGTGPAITRTGFDVWSGVAAPAVSGAGTGRIYFDSGSNTFQVSQNGAAYSALGLGASSLAAVLAAGNITGGTNLLVTLGDRIDAAAVGVLNIGTTTASTVNIGTAAGTVVIPGNFTVNGTTTTINTTTLAVTDPIAYFNNGAGSANSGIAFDRPATVNDAVFVWNNTSSRFELGTFDTTGGTVVPTVPLAATADLRAANLILSGGGVTGDNGATGTSLTFTAGNSSGAGVQGGSVSIVTGTPTDGNGGNVAVTAANGVGADRFGGGISMTAGASTGTAPGGGIGLVAGDGGANANGGGVDIYGGNGGSASGTGGDVTLVGGSAPANGGGGSVNLIASDGGPGGLPQVGGSVVITRGLGANGGADGIVNITGDTTITGKLTVTGIIDPTALLLSGSTDLYFQSADGSTAAVAPANQGRLRYLDGTGWQVSANGAAYNTIATTGSGGTGTWANVLATGNVSGATDAVMSSGQFLRGVDAATGLALQLRGGSSSGGTTTGGALSLAGGVGASTGIGGAVNISGGLATAAGGTGGAVTISTAAAGAGTTLVERWSANSGGLITNGNATAFASTFTAGGYSAANTAEQIVRDTGSNATMRLFSFNGSGSANLNGLSIRGTLAVPTVTQANDQLFGISGGGQYATGVGNHSSPVSIGMFASANWTGISVPTYMTFSTCPVNTISQVERVRIDDLGRNTTIAGTLGSTSTSYATYQTLLAAGYTPSNTLAHFNTETALPVRMTAFSNTVANGSTLVAARWRGTIAAPTAVVTGDALLSVNARGSSAANLTQDLEAGFHRFEVDTGTVTAATSMPSRQVWGTTANGSVVSAERMRITSTGVFHIGDGTIAATYLAGFTGLREVIYAPNNTTTQNIAASFSTTAGDMPVWNFVRGRGTAAVPAIVTNGDSIGYVGFSGVSNTTANMTAGYIRGDTDGTWTNGTAAPGRISIGTTPSGSTTTVERMRINNLGTTFLGDGTLSTNASFLGAGDATVPLVMYRNTASTQTTSMAFSANAGDRPIYTGYRGRGTAAVPAAVANNDLLCSYSAVSVCAVNTVGISGAIDFYCEGTPSGTSSPGRIVLSTTPAGTRSNAERMRISSTGAVFVGDGTLATAFAATTPSTTLYASSQNVGDTVYAFSATAGHRPIMSLFRGRGTAAAPTIVAAQDLLGSIQFGGVSSATTSVVGVDVSAYVDGTPGAAADMPGRLVVSTTPDASGTSVERLRINNLGTSIFGDGTGNASTVMITGSANTPVVTYRNANSVIRNYAFDNADATANAIIQLARGRGTAATPVIPANNDNLGTLTFAGWTAATTITEAAKIECAVDGTPGATNDLPGRVVFYTTPDGSGTALERMRIASTGTIYVGNGATAAAPATATIESTTSSAAAVAGGSLVIRTGNGNTSGSGGSFFLFVGSGGTTGNGGGISIAAGSGGATSGNGGSATFIAGSAATSGTGGAMTIAAGTALGGNNVGGNVAITGGTSAGSGTGGAVTLTGGSGGATGVGGSVTINGGVPTDANGGGISLVSAAGVGTNRNGGAISITGGGQTGSGTAGSITLTAGTSANTGTPGTITITGGSIASGSGTPGGAVTVRGGQGNGAGSAGGLLTLNGGDGASAPGGAVVLRGGNADVGLAGGACTVSGGSGGTTGTAGVVTISGGAGGSTSGNGGAVTVQGGSATDGNGGDVSVSGRDATGTSRTGGAVQISGGQSTTANQGGTIQITAGRGGPTGIGGIVQVIGGQGGSTSGAGGQVTIGGGNPTDGNGGGVQILGVGGQGTNRSGGAVDISAGAATGSGTAGSVSVLGGTGGNSNGTGGTVSVQAGTGGTTNGAGGVLNLFGGDGAGSGAGGATTIRGGQAGATGAGGLLSLIGGAGGATSGNAGSVEVRGGTPVDGNGGYVALVAANGVGTNRNGGDVSLEPGAPTGSGTRGGILFNGRAQGQQGTDVASANDTTLTVGNYFDITGNTQMNGIATTGWRAGSVVILQFDSNPTVKHATAAGGGFASFALAGAVDFSASAGDTLTLVYDGTVWRECARAVI